MEESKIKTFEINGASFAFGLFWQPLTGSTPSERKKEIKALAQELSFDLFVTRNFDIHSVGFAKSSEIKPLVYSAAAVVSKTLEVEDKVKDFIFTSKLPDGSWGYIAQRDGVILADGDLALASEDAARALLMEHMSLGEWPKIIAPEIWGIKGSVERTFEDFISVRKNGKVWFHNWWRLVSIDTKKAIISLHSGKIIVAGFLVFALAAGGFVYKKWKEHIESEAALTVAPIDTTHDTNSVQQPPEHPWKSQSHAAEMMSACIAAMSSHNLFPGNWSVNDVVCRDGTLTISWAPKPGGWIKHLKAIEPTAMVSYDGTSASVSVQIPALQTGTDESIVSEGERISDMYSQAQVYGVTLSTESAQIQPAPSLPGQEQPAVGEPVQRDWKEIKWKVDGVISPRAAIAALDGPGFRMNMMRAKFENGLFVWTMEGMQYVKP